MAGPPLFPPGPAGQFQPKSRPRPFLLRFDIGTMFCPAASSTSVFHSPQESHRPAHLPCILPQLWQTNTVDGFGILCSSTIRHRCANPVSVSTNVYVMFHIVRIGILRRTAYEKLIETCYLRPSTGDILCQKAITQTDFHPQEQESNRRKPRSTN